MSIAKASTAVPPQGWVRARVAGAGGDLPDLRYEVYENERKTGRDSPGITWLYAYSGDKGVGLLGWYNKATLDRPTGKQIPRGQIYLISVGQDWQRRGIATAMLEHARTIDPSIDHDWDNLSPDAQAWSQVTSSLKSSEEFDGEEHTSACIVALPREGDSVYGVGPENKHCTLLFLGPKDKIDLDVLVEEMNRIADQTAPFHADVESVEALGQEGEAQVLLLDRTPLKEIRDAFRKNETIEGYYNSIDQYPSYKAHVTLGYTDPEGDDGSWKPAAEDISSIVFDRLAVWYGATQIEAPLNVELWKPTGGLFSRGKDHLDPRIFDGEHLKPSVTKTVLDSLDAYWTPMFGRWQDWAKVYLAGSAASYWWDTDTDLDLMVGVDLAKLRQARPANIEVSDTAIVEHLNKTLMDMRPAMAAVQFEPGTTPFAVTYFVNEGGAYDVRSIHPYAAYDLSADAWVVHPPVLPADWGPDSIPPEIWRRCEQTAREARATLALPEPDRTEQGIVFFDWIHEGRRAAYSAYGGGWLDFGNVVYQYLEQSPDRLLRRLYLCKHPEAATTADGISATAVSEGWTSIPDLDIHEDWGLPNLLPRERVVCAYSGSKRIGWLVWDEETHLINVVVVEPEYRRMGLATELLEVARQADPQVKHDEAHLTEPGKAWRATVSSVPVGVDWSHGQAGERDHGGGRRPPGVHRRPVARAHPLLGRDDGERPAAWGGHRRDGRPALSGVRRQIRFVTTAGYLHDQIDHYSRTLHDQILSAIRSFEYGRVQATPKEREPLVGFWTIPIGGNDSNSPDRVVLLQVNATDWLAVHVVIDHQYAPVERWVVAMKKRKTSQLASAGVQHQEGTPLDYRGKFAGLGQPQRLFITEPGYKSEYKNTGNWHGSPDDLVAYLDYSVHGDTAYIWFLSTRRGREGQGLANRLVDDLYSRNPGKEIEWGELMSSGSEVLYKRYRSSHPEQTGRGWVYGRWLTGEPPPRKTSGLSTQADAMMYYATDWAWQDWLDKQAGGRGQHDLTKTRTMPLLQRLGEQIMHDHGIPGTLKIVRANIGMSEANYDYITQTATVEIANDMRNKWTLLHEMAHVIPLSEGGDEAVFYDDHGPMFQRIFNELLRTYGGVTDVDVTTKPSGGGGVARRASQTGIYYHVTSYRNWPSIRDNGIQSSQGDVWMWNDPAQAAHYSDGWGNPEVPACIVVIRTDRANLDPSGVWGEQAYRVDEVRKSEIYDVIRPGDIDLYRPHRPTASGHLPGGLEARVAAKTLYHGTDVALEPGDTLGGSHGGRSNYEQGTYSGQGVYLAEGMDYAFWYAVLGAFSAARFDGEPHVYQVDAPQARYNQPGEWLAPEATVASDVTAEAARKFYRNWDDWKSMIEAQAHPGTIPTAAMTISEFERYRKRYS
jgi:ribosomal protein S18 acetylase RimI-like enzyme/2'-5' RNA ligase